MTVLVCGGRDFDSYEMLRIALDRIHQKTPITLIVTGDARGADRLGQLWAKENGVDDSRHPADWKKDGKAAGIIRNVRMLRCHDVDLVVACRGGRGTGDMVRRAERSSIPIVRVGWDPGI